MKNKAPIRKYDITQCALYKCRTKKRLEHLLCLEPGGLKIIDSNYEESAQQDPRMAAGFQHGSGNDAGDADHGLC